MPVFVFLALAAMLAALGLPQIVAVPRAAHVHLALAVGIMPLILGAMIHFVPVLTRSAAPPAAVKMLPALALAAGVLAVASFSMPLFSAAYLVAAVIGLAAALGMAWWVRRRAAVTLGSPHPGVYWYLAAIACLALGLLAVSAIGVWPLERLAFKRFHLHVNLLGFVGLTALGTLQVLLPTAAGRPDGGVARRLRAHLAPALAGALLIASGSAWARPVGWLGLVLLLIPVFQMARTWWHLYRPEIFAVHGAVPPLAAALAGFAVSLMIGAIPADGLSVAHGYVLGFLLPLVSGAASQLLPVWVRPGRQTAWHLRLRTLLCRWGGIRALIFLAGAGMAGAGIPWGAWLAMGGLAQFAGQACLAVLRMWRFSEPATPA